MNSQTYPDSANVWDSLAEAYMKAGETKLARRYYRKSLKLNPENRNARDQLEALEK